MRYTVPLSDQILMFISSVGPGVIIGLLYDVVTSFFGRLGKNTALTIAGDLLFGVTATLISFFYMVIYNSGTVRLNIIIAQLVGAIAFHITMGKYVAKIVGFLSMAIGKAVAVLGLPLRFVARKIRGVCSKTDVSKLHMKKKKAPENSKAT